MIGNKFIAIMTVLVAFMCASLVSSKSAEAEEVVPGDKSLIEPQGASSPSEVPASQAAPIAEGSEAESAVPKSPIRLKTVDYQDTGEASGKLKIGGTAPPGNDLYLFMDDQPFAKVVPDGEGKWSVEGEMRLDEGRHTFRAEQYDPATQMLAGRAMVSIERTKPGAEEAKGQAAPAEPSTPQATTP